MMIPLGECRWDRERDRILILCTFNITCLEKSASWLHISSSYFVVNQIRLPNYLVLDPIYHDLCPSIFCSSCVLENEPHFFLILSPFPSNNSLHSDEQLLAEVARRKLDLHDKITDAVVRETYDFGKVGKTKCVTMGLLPDRLRQITLLIWVKEKPQTHIVSIFFIFWQDRKSVV